MHSVICASDGTTTSTYMEFMGKVAADMTNKVSDAAAEVNKEKDVIIANLQKDYANERAKVDRLTNELMQAREQAASFKAEAAAKEILVQEVSL